MDKDELGTLELPDISKSTQQKSQAICNKDNGLSQEELDLTDTHHPPC